MIELGRRWCTTIGIDPDAPAPTLIIAVAGDATAATATGQSEVGSVVAAVRESCARVKIMVAAHPRPADPDRAAEDAAQAEHARRARRPPTRPGRCSTPTAAPLVGVGDRCASAAPTGG